MTISRSPAWQALSLIEEMFGYFTPARRLGSPPGSRKSEALTALEQMFAYYSRR